jgi:hypothetical protein
VPGRDPNSTVKIDKALAKLDAPFSHAKLEASKLTLTPLSPKGHAAWREKHKLDESKIEQLRAEGKKRGVDDKEIEMAIERSSAATDSRSTSAAAVRARAARTRS